MTGDLKLRISWFLSGNNLYPVKDAYRRWLVCNLVTEEERLEERSDITIRDLRSYIRQNRAQLVRDALTILKAHALAGRPAGDWAPLGSYELWDQIVRGAVHFATGLDCYSTCRAAAKDSESRLSKLALLEAWRSLPDGREDGRGLTATRGVELANDQARLSQYDLIRSVVMSMSKDGKPANARTLGNTIRGMKGAVYDRMKFVQSGLEHHATLWKVVLVDSNNPN